MALVPDNQTSKITEPCKRAFNFPSFPIASQFPAVLCFRFFPIASMRSNQIYFQSFKLLAEWIAVVASICNKSFWPLFGTTTAWARNADRFKCFFSKLYFRWRCRGKGASQRNTLAVDHHHPLRSFAPFGRPNSGPPFFAGAKLPSIKASCQSSAPFSSSMDKNLRHTSSQTPSSSQSLIRRLQADALGYRSGRSCQRAPVRSTLRILPSTSRFSIGGRPPFGLRLGLGSRGSISFHWSFFMKRVYLAIEHLPIA